MREVALWRRLTAEFLGSAFLAAVVIGSGIAAQTLSPGNTGLQLLENAAATAAGLFAIILMFGAVSGGHFNPVVSFVDAAFGGMRVARTPSPTSPPRWPAASSAPSWPTSCSPGPPSSSRPSTGPRRPHFLSEVIATLGLLLVIFALARSGRSASAPAAVGAYIGAAYFFTSSTSFANPAITVGRMFSNTFAGIAPSSVPSFIAAQIVGGVLAVVVIKGVLYPRHHARPRRPMPSPRTSRPETSERRCPVTTDHARGPVPLRAQRREVPDGGCPAAPGAGGRIAVSSAGSEPAETLNPAVVAAMAEIGIDITDRAPTKLTDDMVQAVDVMVTMGCGDACPVYPGKRYLDWELPDPAGQPLDVVRAIRDDIATRVNRLVDELLGEPA